MATTIDVTTENGTPYTWATASFDWNDTQADKSWENAANTIATVNVGEPYAINDVMRPNINKRLLESIHVADTMKTSLQILRKDVLHIGETYWDNINFALKIAESFVVNELRKSTIMAIRKDQINFTEKVIKTDNKYFYEAFATQETALRSLNKIVKESFHLLETSSQAVMFLRTLAESLAVNEVLNKNVQYTREFAETIAVVQTYWDNISFALRIMEGIAVNENTGQAVQFRRTIAESLAVTDVMNHTIARLVMILETLGISDFGDRAVNYKRTVLENISATDLASQAVTFKRFFAERIIALTLNAPAITSPTFTRTSTAYKSDGSVVAAGVPRFEADKGILVEEGTTNLLTSPIDASSYANPATIQWDAAHNFRISGQSDSYGELAFAVTTANLATSDIATITVNYKNGVVDKRKVIQLYNSSGVKITNASFAGWSGWTYNAAYAGWCTDNVTVPFTLALPAGVRKIGFGCGYDVTQIGATTSIDYFQLEAKPYATSFHPSTRTAESLTVPATALNPNEGTIEFDCYVTSESKTLGHKYLINSGSTVNAFNVYRYSFDGNAWFLRVYDVNGGYASCVFADSLVSVGLHRFAISYKVLAGVSIFRVYLDGILVANSQSIAIVSLNSPLTLGTSTGKQLNAYFSNLRISNKARTDEELSYTGPLQIDKNTTYFAPLTEDLDASVYEGGEIVKDVEKPLAEAIGTSESNSKSYGLKKAESFAAADAIKKTAGKKILETLHIAETYWDNVNFALRILEAFAIQEGQHRNITHSAKETLGVSEFTIKHDRMFTFENIVAQERNLKATTKKLSETLTTIDTATQIVNFLRTVAETLHVAEAPTQAVDFHRLFTETAHLADSYKSSIDKELREIFSISQEQKLVDIDKLAKETVAVSEATSKNLATLRKETLHMAETYWDNIAFLVRCLENIHVGEVIRNTSSFKRAWNESVALDENTTMINEFNRLWLETFGTTEGYANAVQFIRKTYETLWVNEGPKKNTAKALQDAFAISDLAAKLVGKPLQEALHVADKKAVNTSKLLQDTLHLVDFVDRNIAFVRKFFETFGTSDKIKQNVETLLRENFSMADKVRNTYQKAVSENFAIASDTFSRQVDFKLKIEEIISSIEGVAMEYGLEINEAINLLDSYITNVKAVLSNIAIREGEMTLADFQNAIATPPGYNTFRDFVVGDYEYQKALMRIVINAPATSSQPVVKDVVPYVDIEDTDDRGEVTITQTTTATKVYFNKFYYNAPEVNVTLKGGSGVITPNIVSTTGLDEGGRYFEVELLNSSGSRVTGTFSWSSKGY